MRAQKIQLLAELLAEVHGWSLVPFYPNENNYSLWIELDETTNIKGG